MDIICINSTFDAHILEFYQEFGVRTPQKDKIYTIRDIRKNSVGGQTGVLLNEIENPQVPIKHPILGVTMTEPSWNLSRFTTLLGDKVKKEEFVNEYV